MLKVFDFKCTAGHVFEVFTTDPHEARLCDCGQSATKIISPTAFVLPANSGFPGKDDRWIREHERAGRNNTVDPV